MTNLSQEEKELILDYCLGVCSTEQSETAQKLISSNQIALELHNNIKNSLSPLDSWQVEPCPDELVERTIGRLKEAASQSHIRLENLIAKEQVRNSGIRNRLWINIGRPIAMAAAFIIVGSVFLGSMNYARHKALQTQCKAQLVNIGNGITSYSNDHNGSMPSVAMPAGTPWWKVGYQGKENYSNTRGIWLLPKNGYVKVEDFICPGSKSKDIKKIDPQMLQQLNDFPNRKYISYSLQITCDKPVRISTFDKKAVMSDLNPLFETLPDDFSESLKIQLNEHLARLNSINHARKGQNILLPDGSVKFVKTRRIGASNDDIFTLQGKSVYEGVEFPSCEADSFLAP